jgi:hypothetical protein
MADATIITMGKPIPVAPDPDPGVLLRQMAMAMRSSRALYAAAELRLADHLAGGAMASADLAGLTSTHPNALHRLLRALAAAGVFTEGTDGRFALTEIGDRLRADHPRSMRAGVLFLAGPQRWEIWSGLMRSLRTGAPAIDRPPGQTIFGHYASNPADTAIANDAMRAFTVLQARAVLAAFDFSRFGTLMDVGGGTGEMLGSVLAATPSLRGMLFDLPHVVAGAGPVLERHGVADRCMCTQGDFFEAVPSGADAILLKQVVHDWEDDRAIALLEQCRQALPAEGSLLILERVMPEHAAPGLMEPFLLDLEMLVGPGGRERTQAEFRTLLAAAGLTITRITPTASPVSVIEARAG